MVFHNLIIKKKDERKRPTNLRKCNCKQEQQINGNEEMIINGNEEMIIKSDR